MLLIFRELKDLTADEKEGAEIEFGQGGKSGKL